MSKPNVPNSHKKRKIGFFTWFKNKCSAIHINILNIPPNPKLTNLKMNFKNSPLSLKCVECFLCRSALSLDSEKRFNTPADAI